MQSRGGEVVLFLPACLNWDISSHLLPLDWSHTDSFGFRLKRHNQLSWVSRLGSAYCGTSQPHNYVSQFPTLHIYLSIGSASLEIPNTLTHPRCSESQKWAEDGACTELTSHLSEPQLPICRKKSKQWQGPVEENHVDTFVTSFLVKNSPKNVRW
jgi:hypothetical protein